MEPTKKYQELTNRILERWEKYQADNEEHMREPHINAGSVLIAIGWALFWFGLGILWFCQYFDVFGMHYPI